jgi:hypothetical protein
MKTGIQTKRKQHKARKYIQAFIANWFLTTVLRKFNGRGQFLQLIAFGKLDIHKEENEIKCSFHTMYTNQLQMDKRLKC